MKLLYRTSYFHKALDKKEELIKQGIEAAILPDEQQEGPAWLVVNTEL